MVQEIKKQPHMCSFACLKCRKVFRRPVEFPYNEEDAIKKCSHCGDKSYNCGRKFHAPKISDDKAWKLVDFLIHNGFVFHSVYDPAQRPSLVKVPYPKTIEEAREFVVKYKNQAIYIEE